MNYIKKSVFSLQYKEFWKDGSLALLIGLLYIFYNGYQFNTGDQAEHLVLIYDRIYPDNYKNDFFLSFQRDELSVRYIYIQLLIILNNVFSLPVLCFSLTTVCITLTAFAWVKIGHIIFNSNMGKVLAPIAAMFIFYNFTIGGNHLQYSMFISGVPAKAFASLALWKYINNKAATTALFCGLATLFQPVAGLLIFGLTFSGYTFLNKSIHFKSIGIYIITGGFMLLPNIYMLWGESNANETQLFNLIYFNFRGPHHYLPHAFPLIQWIKYVSLLTIGSFILFKNKENEPHYRALIFVVIQTLGAFFYTILVEGFQMYSIASIQWFKSTVWTTAILGVVMAYALYQRVQPSIKTRIENFSPNIFLNLCISFLLLIVVTNSKYIPIKKLTHRYQIGNYNKTELTLLHEWIDKNLPAYSVFVTPPSNTSFGCEAKRAMVANAKAVMHDKKYVIAWYENFIDTYGVSIDSLKENGFMATADEKYKRTAIDTSKIKADYAILYKNQPNTFPIVYSTENYLLVKLKK